MQVFISYARTPADTPLARYLATRLREVGIDVWLDESSLRGGGLLQNDIETAIADSSAGLFIVSQSWLISDWTAFELEQFDKRDPHVARRIPIMRLQRERLNVPPALIKMKALTWLEDDADADARFWEVYCAITDAPPGPVGEWSSRGRSLAKSSVRIAAPVAARPASTVRPSLRCDRAPQWTAVDDLATQGFNEVILVAGVAGQAHEHFLERIQKLLRMDPPRSVTPVDWPTRPHSREEFRAALAAAFDVSPDALVDEIGVRLTHANLVLLHPCLRARFVDGQLVKYYSEWLPQLVDECHPRMNLKCVQPVEWPPDAGVAGKLLTWLRLRGSTEEDARPLAEQLIGQLRTRAAPGLRVIRLHDLSDITDDDLNQFCDLMNLNELQKTWLLERIGARSPETPREIFQAIDDYLPDARSLT